MATKTWVGASAGTWNTTGNWTGGVPAANDDLVFNAAPSTTASVNVNASSVVQMASVTSQNSSGSNRWNLQGGVGARSAVGWSIPAGGGTVSVQDSLIVFYFNNITGGKLTKTGLGTLSIPYLSVTESLAYSSWTTGIDVQQGSLSTAFSNNGGNNALFGTGTITFSAGTALDNGSPSAGYAFANNVVVNGNWSFNGIAGRSTIQINGTLALNNAPIITVAGNLAVANGVVSGTTGFTKEGAGQLTLGTANTLSGVVRNNAGILTVSNVNGLQNATLDTSGAGTVTLQASSSLGGLTGSSNYAFTTALTLGGATVDVSAAWTGAFTTATLAVTKRGTGTQQLGGTSTRTGGATAINVGAIQLNSSNGLYASGATGTTTVASGAGLWLSGGISTPANAPIQINGTGVTLDGAIRNIAGNNTVGSTVTVVSDALVKNAVSGTTLTLKALTLGSGGNKLTLDSGSGAAIQMDAAATGTGTSELIITGAGSTTTATTGVLAAAVNRINGTFNSSNTQSIASAKALDGVGTITGAGALSMASGSTLRAGNAAGGETLTVPNLTFASGSQTFQTYKNGGVVSKVASVGALTHTTGSTVQVNASAPSWVSGSTHTFLTYASRSGAGTFTAGTLTGATVRQSISIDAAGLTSQTFTIAGNGNTSVTWAGGAAGDWYDGQTTGWSGTGVTDFKNGDTVTFDATSSATATLTGNVSVASLTMNAAAHTIGGAFTITNAGALTTSGAFKQTLNVAATHAGAINVGSLSTLEVGNANALGGSGTGITLTGTNATLAFTSAADGLSTNRTLTLTPGGAVTQYLETAGNASVTISGTLSGGASGFMTKVGAGLVSLAGTNSSTATVRVGEQGHPSTAAAGANVLHLTNFPSASAPAMRLNSASIFEISQNFAKAYGNAAGQIYLEDTTGVGAGFSARGGGRVVTTAITFGTAGPTTQWNGPLYFGSALGTAIGGLTMTGALALASTQATQTFHVFNGANTSGSSARINDLRSSAYNGPRTFIKAGPGALYVAGGTSTGAFFTTMRVSEGAFEVGPTTTTPISYIEIPSGATNAVVRHEASTAATICPAFDLVPAANFTLEAAATLGAFSVSNALDIGSRTVTLSGSETGIKSSYSGNSTGKYVKTGTGTWSLSYAYASRAAGFSGGADVTQGTLKATQKFALGSGPVTVTAGAKIQFTDTTTDPAIIGSIASLSTTGSTARLIIGA